MRSMVSWIIRGAVLLVLGLAASYVLHYGFASRTTSPVVVTPPALAHSLSQVPAPKPKPAEWNAPLVTTAVNGQRIVVRTYKQTSGIWCCEVNAVIGQRWSGFLFAVQAPVSNNTEAGARRQMENAAQTILAEVAK